MKYLFLLGFSLYLGSLHAQMKEAKYPVGQRFQVDEVEKATVRLNELKAKDAFENALSKTIQFFPDELKDEMVVPGWGNCFVATIHESYDEHRPLTLSPDAIWLTICQGVSIHINQHFDDLESHIFRAEKPDKIVVRNDSLPNGSVHWVDLLHAFSDSTRQYVNDDYYAFFAPEFSTTTNIILTSYEVTMLEGFSQAFEYFGDSGCGIPYITLNGTREDWEAILSRIDKIEELGLELWATELRGVIQKFIDTYDQNIDLDFWQSIYKDHSEYGASYVSGWFIKLFPYLESTGEFEESKKPKGIFHGRAPKIYIPNDYLEGDRYLISRLSTADFPSGIAEIDVHWNDFGTEREMKVHAGFYGMKQHKDLSLEPAISWAVRDSEGTFSNHDFPWEYNKIDHRHVYWTPNTIEDSNLVEKAIYDPEPISDLATSNKHLKINILYNVKENTTYSIKDLKGKTIELLISSKGTFLECRGKEVDEALLTEISKIVKALPQKWSPAKADFRHFINDRDPDDNEEIVLIPANSWVKIEF